MRPLTLVSVTGHGIAVMAMLVMGSLAVNAQEPTAPSSHLQDESRDEGIRDLQKQMNELKSMLIDMHAELARSRSEALELRQEMEATRRQLSAAELRTTQIFGSPADAASPQSVTASSGILGGELVIQKLEEEREVTSAKLSELHQTKVESASKYPVRLSGIVLMNVFSNTGIVDSIDVPTLVLAEHKSDPKGTFGASLRQSLIGLEVFGPRVGGAQLSADVQFDFAGGFPNALDGVTFGVPRLRTGVVRLAWPSTTIVAGQDAPFFSPLSPSSIASLATPAFSYAGNLWNWIPQVRLERRWDVTKSSRVLFQGGILDPLSGEPPDNQFLRTPQAGEASRQPAYATRIAWTHRLFDHELTLGVGGYYSRQDWGFHRTVDGWAWTSDWAIPLSDRWELSGEFYRGRALGGLGGGLGRSALFSGLLTDPFTKVRGLNSMGGWAQLKFRQTEKLEWNGAFGQDSSRARDLLIFPLSKQTYFDPSLARNRSSFLNFIYRPRSDLLFSVEYRRLRTFGIQRESEKASQINLSMGVLF